MFPIKNMHNHNIQYNSPKIMEQEDMPLKNVVYSLAS